MSKPQHYPITLEKALAHYRQGDLTAKGLLHIYLNIRLKQGWTLRETQKQICETLGISRAAFYSALSRLKAEGSINWSTPENTKYSITLNPSSIVDNSSMIVDDQSMIVDSQSTIIDSQSSIVDNQSIIMENEPPKPSHSKEFSDSPDLYSNSFQIFINSLSEDERASFLNFCKKSVEHYKKPVVNLDDYLASVDATGQERWTLLRNQWHQSKQLAHSGVLNPGSKGVDEKVINLINSSDPRIQLINRLKKNWGEREYSRLISAIYDGWIYFFKIDNALPLEQAIGLDSNELKAIAEGEF